MRVGWAALGWLARSSVPVSALQEASVVCRALDACGRKLDGSAAAPEYHRRRRRTFYAALKLIAAVAAIGRTQGPRLRAQFGRMYYGMLRSDGGRAGRG